MAEKETLAFWNRVKQLIKKRNTTQAKLKLDRIV
jgi:hypothetical protein